MFADHPDMTVLVHEDVEFTWTEEGTIVDLNDRVVNEERDMYRITYLAFDDNLQAVGKSIGNQFIDTGAEYLETTSDVSIEDFAQLVMDQARAMAGSYNEPNLDLNWPSR